MNKDSVDKGWTGWNLHYRLKANGLSLSNVNKRNTQKYGEAYGWDFGGPKNPDRCQNDTVKQKIKTVLDKRNARWRQSLSAPKTRLEEEESALFRRMIFSLTDFNNGRR
jgi:hypothetical protein